MLPTGALLVPPPRSLSIEVAYLRWPSCQLLPSSSHIRMGHSPDQLRIDAGDRERHVLEDIALDQHLGIHAGVDGRAHAMDSYDVSTPPFSIMWNYVDMNAGGVSLLVVRVVDVPGAETDQGAARVAVLPVVVGIRDVQLARVLGRVAVAVSAE